MPRTLRLRLTVAATVVVALALATAATGLVLTVRRSLVGQALAAAEADVELVAQQLEAGVHVEQIRAGNSGALIEVRDERGDVLLAAPPLTPGVALAALPLEPPAGGEAVVIRLDTDDIVVAERRVQTPDGVRTVVAADPLLSVARGIDEIVDALSVGVPLLVGLAALAAWVIVGRALRPIEAIRAEAEEITATTLDRRVPEPPAGDEVGRLARTVNGMLDRLEEAAERQRRFTADASHELRSPIAAIRTELEVALHRPGAADWPAVARDVLAEDERLERLVADLLDLARLDELGDAQGGPVDLAAIARAEAARPRRVPVTAVGGTAVVTGSASLLTRVVSNLLDNAARHAASAARIEVRTAPAGVELEVDDDGPGVAPTDRERLFERFTRGDDARSRADGGVGLGLALVRRAVTLHQGTVGFEDSRLGGARVVVRLPARRAG